MSEQDGEDSGGVMTDGEEPFDGDHIRIAVDGC